jgi:hypothetical protein
MEIQIFILSVFAKLSLANKNSTHHETAYSNRGETETSYHKDKICNKLFHTDKIVQYHYSTYSRVHLIQNDSGERHQK